MSLKKFLGYSEFPEPEQNASIYKRWNGFRKLLHDYSIGQSMIKLEAQISCDKRIKLLLITFPFQEYAIKKNQPKWLVILSATPCLSSQIIFWGYLICKKKAYNK